jgi:PAS domain S-box-containing protein
MSSPDLFRTIKSLEKSVYLRYPAYEIAQFVLRKTLTISIFCLLIIATAHAQSPDVKKVLILHSYHQGFTWTDRVMDGIQSIFDDPSDLTIEPYIEYMDVKRNRADEAFPHLERLYDYRYGDMNFDVIIVSDDFGLNFLLERRDRLFQKVPIVFCGINNFDISRFRRYSPITGVAEDADLKGTITLALKLHPATKHLAVINDGVPTGVMMRDRVRKVMPAFKDKLELIELFDLSVADLKKALRDLPEDTVIFHIHFYHDKGTGQTLTVDKSFAIVKSSTDLPVYTGWDHLIGYGATGGMVINGKVQGSIAAQMAFRILNGEPADTIPPLNQSPNTPMFDYNFMAPFGISKADLPEGSIILNEPISFYYRFKIVIGLTAGSIFLLILINIVLIINIARRKTAEAELRESEERFRILFEHAPDPFYINRMNGTLVDGNSAAEKFLGYRRKELIGTNFLEKGILSDQDIPRALYLLEKNKNGEPTGPDEFTLYRKDGSPAYAEITTHPVNIKGEKLVLGVARDITERKKVEQERVNLEARLRQAQKMEAVGTLAGGIAHDFNNILSAVFGFTEIALNDVQVGSPLYKNLKEVLKAGERAKSLVRQILTFSRQTEHEQKPVQVRIITREALKLLRASLPTTIEIRTEIRSDAAVFADSTQLHQVVMNLCTNASHAMQEKGGILEVRLVEVEIDPEHTAFQFDLAPGSYLELTVSDTGHGMSAEVLNRIFDPFFTTKEKGEGTGMGLSVVHGIIKSHSGEISVYSEPGKGSTFKVYLPIIEQEVISESDTAQPLPAGSERILFIDDEKTLVDIGKQILEHLGYDVEVRTSSYEALELFKVKSDKFDLVITDMTMPGMTGEQLTKEILKIRPGIPIILCTGYSKKITEEKAKRIGIKSFAMKPVVAHELAMTVRKVLDEG